MRARETYETPLEVILPVVPSNKKRRPLILLKILEKSREISNRILMKKAETCYVNVVSMRFFSFLQTLKTSTSDLEERLQVETTSVSRVHR